MGTSVALDFFRKFQIHFYLLLAGIVTYHTYDLRIASDMAKYMSYALNLFQGNGYLDFDGEMVERGPLFPLMIAASYWLLGESPWSAFWVVRIFCILNPVLVYVLGKELFGKRVGLSAALLVLTSYGVGFWSYRHLDAVWSFFALASILCL